MEFQSIVDYHRACIETPIEQVIEIWHALWTHREGYPQWAQAEDVREAIMNSPLYTLEQERALYRKDVGL